MKKCFFLILAVFMIFALSVSIRAREIPVVDSGVFKVAAVTGTAEEGYVIDETARFWVIFSYIPDGEENCMLRSKEGQVRIKKLQESYIFEELQVDAPFKWIDPITVPYTLTEADCREGKLLRFMLLPDEPDIPDEEPDAPDQSEIDEVPDKTNRQEKRTTSSQSDGGPEFAAGSGGGMLKGSREIPAGGILLNTLLGSNRKSRTLANDEIVAEAALSAAREALSHNDGETLRVTVPLGNTETVTPELLNAVKMAVDEVAGEERSNALSVNTVLQADTVTEDGISARMYIDMEAAEKNNAAINTVIDSDGRSGHNQAVQACFERHFENQVATAAFAQRGSFGMEISVAIKADLSRLNEDALLFYTYDSETNRYSRLMTGYTIDRNGYLHLNTSVGDNLIITDALLTPK